MDVVLLIGAVQALFFAILVLNKKGIRMPDKILAFWLLVFALHLSFIYFLFHKGYDAYVAYGGYVSGIIITYYSLMYVYAKSIISNDGVFKKNWLIHILPTIITYICMIPIYQMSFNERVALFEDSITDNLVLNVSIIVVVLFVTMYLILIFRLLNKHEANIKKLFSFEENVNLAWLKKLSIILTVIWSILIISVSYVYYLDYTTKSSSLEFYIDFEMYGYGLFVGFVYLLGYFGYKQGNIFSYDTPSKISRADSIESDEQINSKPLDSNSEITKEEDAFVNRLNKYMNEQKPYLENELSLFQLAKELDVSTHYLSNILNNYIHKNFYEFINNYRVDEVKRRIVSNKNSNFTILAIALDCGFNSKATFNRIFKNYTGYTPSQFQQEYK